MFDWEPIDNNFAVKYLLIKQFSLRIFFELGTKNVVLLQLINYEGKTKDYYRNIKNHLSLESAIVFKVSVMTERCQNWFSSIARCLKKSLISCLKPAKHKSSGCGNVLKHGFHGNVMSFEQNTDAQTRFPINFVRSPHVWSLGHVCEYLLSLNELQARSEHFFLRPKILKHQNEKWTL